MRIDAQALIYNWGGGGGGGSIHTQKYIKHKFIGIRTKNKNKKNDNQANNKKVWGVLHGYIWSHSENP